MFRLSVIALAAVALLPNALAATIKFNTDDQQIPLQPAHCVEECQQPAQFSIMGTSGLMAEKLRQRQECLDEGECAKYFAPRSLTPCENGKAGEYPCSNVDLLSFVNHKDLGSKGNGNDIWGWEDPETGREYAIVCQTDGTAFVDITDPTDPIFVGRLPSNNPNQQVIWRDAKVYKNHVYITSEGFRHGMQVFDLTQLRTRRTRVVFTPVTTYTEFGSCHNIVINEESGFAYGVGSKTCRGGLHAVDIREPANPKFAGCFANDGYTHDAQCVIYRGPDAEFHGREICFGYNEDTLTVVDVTNKTSPLMISRTPYKGSAYTHQGWLTEDQAYILHNDEKDELNGLNQGFTQTYIWNVQSLRKPIHQGNYFSPVKSVDHNLYIKGNLGYLSNYGSGLRIVDLSGIAENKIKEVAYFDVFPARDAVRFEGAWSVYPYFKSGNLIINSIERGLFVVKHNA